MTPNRALALTLLPAVLLLLAGCPFDTGGGGGGGGGGSGTSFTKGFVFLKKDDRNVYVANQAGEFQDVKQLTTEGGARQPSLSRDGKAIAFVRQLGSEVQVVTVPAAGGAAGIVLTSATTAALRNPRAPVFSPDGTRLAFSYDEGGGSAIGLVNVDGTGFGRLVGGGALSYAFPVFSPDGTKVYAAAGNTSAQLTQVEVVDVATGSALSVTNTLGVEAQGIVSRLAVSPDGKRLAFDGRVGSGSNRIFVLALDTKVVTQVTDYPGDPGANDSSPSWVGADQLGFSSDSGGNDNVYILPASATKTSGGLQLAGAIEPWFGPN
jgi:TolB protein